MRCMCQKNTHPIEEQPDVVLPLENNANHAIRKHILHLIIPPEIEKTGMKVLHRLR